jgi:N-ethylmaleimide reductase
VTTRTQNLFTPVQVGPFTLNHRVVMAPLTRSRSIQPGDIPSDLMLEYYTQRASEGGLVISEATSISIGGRGWFGAPGMYSDEQVAGWKKITSAVHLKGARMFSQLWHVGRSSHVSMTNGAAPVAPSIDPQYWLDSNRTRSPGRPVAREFRRQTSSCYRLRQAKRFGPMGEMNLAYSHVIMTMDGKRCR